MSEKGWKEFLAADGVEDWVVLHGGATAAFRVESAEEAVRLALALTRDLEVEPTVVMTMTSNRLAVRLTRDVWQLEPRHIDLARAISETARTQGATPDRTAVQEVQFAIASKPDDVDLDFWRAVLGYDQISDDSVVDRLGHGSTVWMQPLDPGKSLRHAMHVDVSVASDQAEHRLAAALEAGGRIVDDSEAPRWWTLSDRAGNRVCIASWPDGAGASDT